MQPAVRKTLGQKCLRMPAAALALQGETRAQGRAIYINIYTIRQSATLGRPAHMQRAALLHGIPQRRLIFRKAFPSVICQSAATLRSPTRSTGVAGEANWIIALKRLRCSSCAADFLSFMCGW